LKLGNYLEHDRRQLLGEFCEISMCQSWDMTWNTMKYREISEIFARFALLTHDRVKYGSGKIWRNRSKPTTFSRSLFNRCPTCQFQNSKIMFRMYISQFQISKFGNFCVTRTLKTGRIINHCWYQTEIVTCGYSNYIAVLEKLFTCIKFCRKFLRECDRSLGFNNENDSTGETHSWNWQICIAHHVTVIFTNK